MEQTILIAMNRVAPTTLVITSILTSAIPNFLAYNISTAQAIFFTTKWDALLLEN